MNYKTYADLSIDILQEIHKIPQDIHLIVGIPRSGMIPAYMLGAQLNLPVITLNEFLQESWEIESERKLKVRKDEISKVLILDDSVFSGKAILKAKHKLDRKQKEFSLIFSAVYSATKDNDHVDFYLKYLPVPRVFQWNFKNHFNNTQACFDIDGVLCLDPTEEENDDGKAYQEFLKNAKPLFIPKQKIPCLVTSRLEKYRPETETWLQNNGVEYKELCMLDLPSAKERRALQLHAKFKAEVYKQRPEQMFVESNWKQAKEIFQLTNKPVFCTQNDVLINNLTDIAFYENMVTYAGRHFRDVFSDDSELSLQMQKLRWQLGEGQLEIEKLQKKIKKLENSKWIKFSKLNKKNKAIFLFKKFFRF